MLLCSVLCRAAVAVVACRRLELSDASAAMKIYNHPLAQPPILESVPQNSLISPITHQQASAESSCGNRAQSSPGLDVHRGASLRQRVGLRPLALHGDATGWLTPTVGARPAKPPTNSQRFAQVAERLHKRPRCWDGSSGTHVSGRR